MPPAGEFFFSKYFKLFSRPLTAVCSCGEDACGELNTDSPTCDQKDRSVIFDKIKRYWLA